MEVFFLRHGESEANISGILCGQLDSPLTQEGHRQGKRAGAEISKNSFDLIYSSPLVRALDTAKYAVSDITQAKLVDDLKEHDTGLHSDKLKSEYVESVDSRMAQQHLYPDIPFLGGESLNDLKERTFSWFEKEILNPDNLNKKILIVAHNGTINGILSGFFGISMNHFKAFNLKNTGSIEVHIRYDEAIGWTGSIVDMIQERL